MGCRILYNLFLFFLYMASFYSRPHCAQFGANTFCLSLWCAFHHFTDDNRVMLVKPLFFNQRLLCEPYSLSIVKYLLALTFHSQWFPNCQPGAQFLEICKTRQGRLSSFVCTSRVKQAAAGGSTSANILTWVVTYWWERGYLRVFWGG